MTDLPPGSRSLRIIIACGGTGGHMFPGIAVAQELVRLGHRPLLLISRKQVDSDGSHKYPHLEFLSLPAIAKPRTFSLRMLPFLWRFFCSLVSSIRLLRRKKAHAVLGMGGFTSLAPVLAGRLLGLRTYVHDSNAVPGRANRLTARFCSAVLLGLNEAGRFFPKRRCCVVGTPVREELLHALPSQAEARARLGLPTTGCLLLVTGGSQGAQTLNSCIAEAARTCPQVFFLLIAGEADRTRMEKQAAGLPNIKVLGFCADMPAAYAAADAVVARSGASTLTELSVLGKVCLLVPFPYAADNHQFFNANVFATAGAAVLCEQHELTPEKIVQFLTSVVLSPVARESVQAAMRAQAHPDAASRIANIISAQPT